MLLEKYWPSCLAFRRCDPTKNDTALQKPRLVPAIVIVVGGNDMRWVPLAFFCQMRHGVRQLGYFGWPESTFFPVLFVLTGLGLSN